MPDYGWGVERWGEARWGVVRRQLTASDALSLADTLRARPRTRTAEVALSLADALRGRSRLAKAEALTMADGLRRAAQGLLSDGTALTDSVSPRVLFMFADTIALADSLLVLDQALREDAVAMPDLVRSLSKVRLNDQIAASDGIAIARHARPRVTDATAVADALAAAVSAYRADLVILADEMAAASRFSRADVLSVLEGIAAAVARGTQGGAITLADDLLLLISIPEAANDPAGDLLDTLAAVICGKSDESASLAEFLTQRVGKYVTGLLSAIDEIKAEVDSSLGDISGTTDSVGLRVVAKRTVSDLLLLADGVQSSVTAHRPEPTDWGFGRWGCSVFGGKDGVGLSDRLSIAQAVATLAEDVIALADVLLAETRAMISEQLASGDDVASQVQAMRAGQAPISDDVALRSLAVTDGQLLAVADQMLRAVAGVIAGDAVGASDDLVRLAIGAVAVEMLSAEDDARLRVAGLLADILSLDDVALAKMGRMVTDAAAVVDALNAQVGLHVQDDQAVSEALALLMTLGATADTASVADDILATLAGRLASADDVATMDALRVTVALQLAGALGLDDHLAMLSRFGASNTVDVLDAVITQARPLAAEALGVPDRILQAAVKMVQAGTVSLADLLVGVVGSTPADAQPVADHLVVSLQTARQADELLDAIDDARAAVRRLLPDALGLDDRLMLDIQAARAEALELAELLGMATGKQLPDDMTGIVDESRLRAAMGLEPDNFGVLDRVQGRVMRVLQQVFIQGVQVPVSGLRVHHSASDRVGTCSFSIPNPSPQVLALARQRAEVRVYLLDGEGTDFFSGRIVGNPVQARGTISTELQITADDWTAAAQDIFVQEVYTSDSGTLDQIVKRMWGKYFDYPIRLDLVAATDRNVDLYRINYSSLFDATEQLAQLLGWVWFVDWDGADLMLRFYPPSSAVAPVTLSRANRNVVANTARFGQDEQIKNSVYVFGGDGRSAPYTERLVADGERAAYRLAYKPYRPAGEESGVEALVGDVEQLVGIWGLHSAEDFDVLLDFHERQLIWPNDKRPAAGAVIEVRYSYAYPILVHLTDDQSIAQFGVSESVVTDSKITDIRTAREVGRAQLRESAWPRGYGACEVLVPGLRAGQFVTVDMPAYGASGLYEILEVEKWIDGSTVRRRVTLNVADSPEVRIAERLREFARRIASLESLQRAEDISVQRILRDPGNVAIAAVGIAAGDIRDQEHDTSMVGEVTAVTHKTLGAAWVQVASQRLLLADVAAAAMGPKNNSIGQAQEYIKGGISFWGHAKWGEKPWGVASRG
jgi:hypothetical protein